MTELVEFINSIDTIPKAMVVCVGMAVGAWLLVQLYKGIMP